MQHHRWQALGAAALVGALGLTACGQGGGATGEDGVTTIVWDMWSGDAESEQRLREQMAAAQQVVGDDIRIELQTAPWADYFTRLNANLASGNVACVTSMNGQRLSGYREAFVALGEEELAAAGISREEYDPAALSVLEHEGELLGLPYDTATMLLFYNADLFEAAGVELPTNDWTLQDFQAAAEEVTAGTDAQGFAVSLDEFQWLSLPMARTGEQAVDESGALALTAPGFVDAASWYASLVTELGVSAAPPSAADSAWTATQFENGRAAMIVEGTWNAASYTDPDNAFQGGAVRVPAGDGGPYGVALGSGYGVTASCENPDEALRVLGALAGEEAQAVVAEQGGFPAQLDSQQLFYDSLPETTREELTAAFDSAFEGATGQRVTEEWTQVSTAMPNELVGVYAGQTEMAAALANLQSRFGG